MVIPGNQHYCASCTIGIVSFPIRSSQRRVNLRPGTRQSLT